MSAVTDSIPGLSSPIDTLITVLYTLDHIFISSHRCILGVLEPISQLEHSFRIWRDSGRGRSEEGSQLVCGFEYSSSIVNESIRFVKGYDPPRDDEQLGM
jgi:hypothetical protein